MSFADEFNRKFASVDRVSSTVGVFIAMVGSLARVNMQGVTVDVRCDGWNPPVAGMPVRVESLNGAMRVTGPAKPLPARATIVESLDGGTRASFTDGTSTWVLPVMAPYIPIPGDVAIINWAAESIAGEEAAPPPPPPPEAAPIVTAPVAFSNLLVMASASGKWDKNWGNYWGGSEVWASNSNDGLWVYSRRLGALAGAHVTRVEIFLPVFHEVGSCSIATHPHENIPGGAPVLSNLHPLSPRGGWVELPSWWGNLLRDNPWTGIGVTSPSGGLNKWRGTGQDGMSGALRFAGTR